MDDYLLVLNAGSSSVKFCVFLKASGESWKASARGQIEGIGTTPRISARDSAGSLLLDQHLESSVKDQHTALDALAQWLQSVYSDARVLGVGHRVVHGGSQYTGPTVITQAVLSDLHALEPLAPLHQPHNLDAIEAVSKRLPNVQQVACFDTSFHRTQSELAQLVPLPRHIREGGVQRYGFHGLSYEYIASVLPGVAPDLARGRVIAAHLGNGASLCAMKQGRSVDCSLGFTALDGLCMGTRPGSVDPGVILHLFQNLHLDADAVSRMLYKESGLLGISGLSNDMRVLLDSAETEARLAIDYFVYRATKEIGALASVLGGIDGLVFTAGIGENSAEIRKRICRSSEWLGIELQETANSRNESRISARGSKVSVWVIPTNEELMIAQHTATMLGWAAHA